MPITPERQPALYRLVQDAASRLGVSVPKRIWLGPEAVIQGDVGPRGASLVVGLPVAYALSRTEVAALVEHELAVLAAAPSWGASRRYRRWANAMDFLVTVEGNEPAGRVRRLGSPADAVERAADTACGDAAVAARALIRLARVADDFLSFCVEVEQALTRFGGLRCRVADLHDGWRRRLAEGTGPADDGDLDHDDVAMLAGRHPVLAAAASDLLGQPMRLRPSPDAVLVTPLTRREQRTLASAFLSARGWVPWRTFATVAPRFWRRAAARQARHVLVAVAGVLGREPAGSAEAADVIRGRPAEVIRGRPAAVRTGPC